MRINKFLASCELGSRRSVEQLITSGKVKVNGEIVTNLAHQIMEGDKVLVNNKLVKMQTQKVYYLLNKPKGYLSSVKSENGKPSVLQLLKHVSQQVYPVGRLDFNTEGMLILTNDGDFANQVIHPKNEIKKTYEVIFTPQPTQTQLQALQTSMNIDGYQTKPAIVKNVRRLSTNMYSLQLIIHEGRNRQVRKMFEQVKLKVTALTRIQIGQLKLQDIQTGQYVTLEESDLKKIFK